MNTQNKTWSRHGTCWENWGQELTSGTVMAQKLENSIRQYKRPKTGTEAFKNFQKIIKNWN